jgi:hypothetical protein
MKYDLIRLFFVTALTLSIAGLYSTGVAAAPVKLQLMPDGPISTTVPQTGSIHVEG